MCPNGTLLRTIEDLANIVTIRMLRSPELTSLEPTLRSLVSSNTVNMHDSRFLFLSHAIAPFFICHTTGIRMYSLHLNGVSHSVSFSSIVATTRNPEFCVLGGRNCWRTEELPSLHLIIINCFGREGGSLLSYRTLRAFTN